jgi:cytochrome c553
MGRPLVWAYSFVAKDPPDHTPTGTVFTVPGSALKLTEAQLGDYFNPPDWKPHDHPAMPAVVAHGRKPDVLPCALCHLPNGQGTRGAVNLSGLSASYIVQQMGEMKGGRRRTADLRRPGIQLMVNTAVNIAPSDIARAAAYYASQPYRPGSASSRPRRSPERGRPTTGG